MRIHRKRKKLLKFLLAYLIYALLYTNNYPIYQHFSLNYLAIVKTNLSKLINYASLQPLHKMIKIKFNRKKLILSIIFIFLININAMIFSVFSFFQRITIL